MDDMIDLELTDTGDIAWSSVSSDGRFRLRFTLAEHKGQHIHFLCMPSGKMRNLRKKEGQHIRFRFAETGEEYKIQSGLVKENQEKLQAMFIALKTELGDVNDEYVGSDFYKVRHNIIANTNDLDEIRSSAAEVVRQFFPNGTLEAEYAICPEAKNFKYQSVRFTLRDEDNKVITSFIH